MSETPKPGDAHSWRIFMACTLAAMTMEFSSDGWSSPAIWISLISGLAGLALFFWWEQQVPHPVFDLALFKDLTAGSPSLWASFSRA